MNWLFTKQCLQWLKAALFNDGVIFALSFMWRVMTALAVALVVNVYTTTGMNWFWKLCMMVWIMEPLYYKFKDSFKKKTGRKKNGRRKTK